MGHSARIWRSSGGQRVPDRKYISSTVGLSMVAESTGAWEPEAGKLLLHLSRSAAARTEGEGGLLHSSLLQELCVVVRSHRARAVLRRRAELSE